MKNYYKALANFQQECPVLLKATDGYGYKYVDLPTIIYKINPLMKKHGLGFTQELGTNPTTGASCVTTTIFHVDSGEHRSATIDIPLVELKGQNPYQSFGSGTSYFKRYQLTSALGIVSDKDIDAYGEIKETPKPIQIELNIGDDNWKTVLSYIAASKKTLSFEEIIKKLETKYSKNSLGKCKVELKKGYEGNK